MDAQQIVNAVALGGVYSLFAVGFTLQFGILHIFNVAHASLFMVAAVALLTFADIGMPAPLAIIAAVLSAGVVGVLIERVAVRPLRRAEAGILPIFVATIAVAAVITFAVQLTFGANVQYLDRDFFGNGEVSILGARATVVEVVTVAVSVVAYAALMIFVKRTRQGRAMRAVAENPPYAERVGVSSDGVYTLVFFVSSLLAGLAGVMSTLMFSNVYSQMHLPLELRGFAIVVLGGLGSVFGAAVGAFILAFAEVFAVVYGSSALREFVPFLILFLVLAIRPRGLFGRTFREI